MNKRCTQEGRHTQNKDYLNNENVPKNIGKLLKNERSQKNGKHPKEGRQRHFLNLAT